MHVSGKTRLSIFIADIWCECSNLDSKRCGNNTIKFHCDSECESNGTAGPNTHMVNGKWLIKPVCVKMEYCA